MIIISCINEREATEFLTFSVSSLQLKLSELKFETTNSINTDVSLHKQVCYLFLISLYSVTSDFFLRIIITSQLSSIVNQCIELGDFKRPSSSIASIMGNIFLLLVIILIVIIIIVIIDYLLLLLIIYCYY